MPEVAGEQEGLAYIHNSGVGRGHHEGIAALQKAIQLRPDYDDAMAYLNLLYRRKADMVESANERASLKKQADDLVDKVKEIKQKRAEQPQQAS